MKCLDDNGYDKAKCQKAFDNYNACRKFWYEVRVDMKVLESSSGCEMFVKC